MTPEERAIQLIIAHDPRVVYLPGQDVYNVTLDYDTEVRITAEALRRSASAVPAQRPAQEFVDRRPQTVETGGAFVRAFNEEMARAFNEERPILWWNDGVVREVELHELTREQHINRYCTCPRTDTGSRLMSDMECPMYNLHR